MELHGVSIASLGVTFQMFNAAFLNAPVDSPDEMEERLTIARRHFLERNLPWAFWICEDWLDRGVRRKLSRTLPGLWAAPDGGDAGDDDSGDQAAVARAAAD